MILSYTMSLQNTHTEYERLCIIQFLLNSGAIIPLDYTFDSQILLLQDYLPVSPRKRFLL
jgi:hypothetical protein